MKRLALNTLIILLVFASILSIYWGVKNKSHFSHSPYDDNIDVSETSDLTLDDSNVQVTFSDVVLSKQKETRELIVSTQEATVTATLENNLIKQLDIAALKKSQKVTYKGTGYFIVKLDNLTNKDILVDNDKKTVTIKIEEPQLKDIVIDPNKIKIGDTENGLLNWGKVKLTVADYNKIEKELLDQMDAKFNTTDNMKAAKTNALKMVKEVYEPVIKAVDNSYELKITF